jgi:hypothetical protein
MVPTTVVSVHECELERRSRDGEISRIGITQVDVLALTGTRTVDLRRRSEGASNTWTMSDSCSTRPLSRRPASSAPRSRTSGCSRCWSAKGGPPPRLGLVASLLGWPHSSGSLDHLTKPREGCAVAGRRGPLKMPVRRRASDHGGDCPTYSPIFARIGMPLGLTQIPVQPAPRSKCSSQH